MFKCSNVQMFKCSNIEILKYQIFKCQMSDIKCQISVLGKVQKTNLKKGANFFSILRDTPTPRFGKKTILFTFFGATFPTHSIYITTGEIIINIIRWAEWWTRGPLGEMPRPCGRTYHISSPRLASYFWNSCHCQDCFKPPPNPGTIDATLDIGRQSFIDKILSHDTICWTNLSLHILQHDILVFRTLPTPFHVLYHWLKEHFMNRMLEKLWIAFE